MMEKVYIVQDKETLCFLFPRGDGDVGLTRLLHQAGRFFTYEEATETAGLHCPDGCHITGFFEDEDSSD
jgi:hypothetical protein